jgi:hypothetical protein
VREGEIRPANNQRGFKERQRGWEMKERQTSVKERVVSLEKGGGWFRPSGMKPLDKEGEGEGGERQRE